MERASLVLNIPMLTLLKEYVLLTHALQTRSLKKMEHA
jgi:hypothetical protein